jgi:hypothetical protein
MSFPSEVSLQHSRGSKRSDAVCGALWELAVLETQTSETTVFAGPHRCLTGDLESQNGFCSQS